MIHPSLPSAWCVFFSRDPEYKKVIEYIAENDTDAADWPRIYHNHPELYFGWNGQYKHASREECGEILTLEEFLNLINGEYKDENISDFARFIDKLNS